MKKKERKRWIPILMGLSQVLLTGFVFYWLVGQFKSERESLYKELHYEFLEAQNQAMDSSLHVMLQPLLKDSIGEKGRLTHAGRFDSSNAVIDTLHMSSVNRSNGPISDQIVRFDIRGNENPDLSNKATYEITTIPHQEAVLRGVKMIIKMSDDSLNVEGGNIFTSMEVDSVLLMNIASKRLKEINHSDFKVVWYEDNSASEAVDYQSRIRFHSAIFRNPMVYEVTNFEPFLFRKIIPQILFGLLLLLLTGSAFIFTYRSLKKQLLLNTLRNEFISNVSHELKTPVSTVKVALESLQSYDQKKDPRVTEEYLKMASLEMDRLDLLIQKILNQSLLDSNKLPIYKEKNDIVDLCKNVIQSFKPRVLDLNGTISFNTDCDELLINIDDLYIQGVIINLLDNALKYGGEPPEIDINISKGNGSCRLAVSDNGHGIPREYHEKVFDRFFRIPTGDRHNVKGYGLGLSFASEVIRQHNGSIKLENNKAGGCTFTVIFPEADEA